MGSPTVTSRVLAILAAFDTEHRVLTLTEIGARAGLPLSTAHRLVANLVDWGALARREDGGYVIGRRMWNLGLLAPDHAELQQVAEPFLHDLYGATLATVHLGQRDGTQVLYLDRLSGHASVPVVSQTGDRLPLHATGVGKVLLAWAPEEVQDEVLRDLVRITPHTITSPVVLRAQLERVRRDGFAHTSEEMSLGACSVAVPIRGADAEVIASLGIVVADLRRSRGRLVAALQVAAHGIGRSLATQSHRGARGLPVNGRRGWQPSEPLA